MKPRTVVGQKQKCAEIEEGNKGESASQMGSMPVTMVEARWKQDMEGWLGAEEWLLWRSQNCRQKMTDSGGKRQFGGRAALGNR